MLRNICIFLLTLITSLLNLKTYAQPVLKYGNEWINYTHKYIKIKVASDGVFIITYQDLITAGLSLSEISQINPNGFQLFYRGEEQFIYVLNQSSGVFGNQDFIEFIGKRNDGKAEKSLFKKPEWQPQDVRSIFSDTSIYFLTWSNTTTGKRYQWYNNTSYSNFTPLSHTIQHEIITFPTGQYYDGLNYTSNLKYHQAPDYTEGEGYISTFIWNKGGYSPNINILDIDNSSGNSIEYRTELFGVREPTYRSSNNNYSHHIRIKLRDSKKVVLDSADRLFTEYEHPQVSIKIPATFITTPTYTLNIDHQIVNDLNILYDINYIQRMELIYPRKTLVRGVSQTGLYIPFSGKEEYIKITDYASGKNQPFIYIPEKGIKIKCGYNTTQIDAILPSTTGEQYIYIADSSDRKPVICSEVFTFTPIDTTTGTNFLIISHPRFSKSTQLYKNYRDSTGFKAGIFYINHLYDQFGYGNRNPLALRNFCAFMLDKNLVKPAYMLIIGKGVQTDYFKSLADINYIPTWGVPGSDSHFSLGLSGSLYEPAIPTGRVPALIDSQVYIYLEKIKSYERSISVPSLWKKSLLHTGGGLDIFQTQSLRYTLEQMQGIAENDSFGGTVTSYYKFQTIPVTGSLTSAIQEDLKNGKTFTYYFGHGASDRMEIDMGDPVYCNNLNKLPVMMTAGCLLGNCYFSSTPQMGEKWLFAHKPNKTLIDPYGAIAWIGNTWFGYQYELSVIGRTFYTNLFKKQYGKSIGQVLISTIQDFQDSTNSLNETHCKELNIMGDPSIKIYSPAYPDYMLANKYTAVGIPASISVFPENTSAMSDSFSIRIDIYNQGKTQEDSIYVRVKRTYPDGRKKTYQDLLVFAPKYKSTVDFWITSKDITTKGKNTFQIEINPDKKVNENGSYNNNSMLFDYYMQDNNATILFPPSYSIVNNTKIKITAQASNTANKANTYIFELDTNPKFNSVYKQSVTITGGNITDATFNLLSGDTQAYYIRVKIADTALKIWSEGSFTYIPNGQPGWGQVEYNQYRFSTPDQIYMNDGERNYSFSSMSSNTYYFYSTGENYQPGNNWRARVFRKNNGENMAIVNGQVQAGQWGLVAIDPVSETPYINPSKYQYKYNKNPTPVYLFPTTQAGVLNDFKSFLDSIPDGYRVYLCKGEQTGFDTWSTQDLMALVKIGSNISYLKKIKDAWPLAIKGIKGKSGSAYHVTADTNDKSTPPDKQIVILSDQLGVPFTKGSLKSTIIGPAKTWGKIFLTNNEGDHTSDKAEFDVIQIDKNGTESPITTYTSITDDSLDISNINTQDFPYIKIQTRYTDDSLRTPDLLRNWIVTYQGVPEGTVLSDLKKPFLISPFDTINHGDTVVLKIPFQNISLFNFDSILTEVFLTDNMQNQTLLFSGKTTPLKPGDTLFFYYKFSSSGLNKQNYINVTFNPGFDQSEQYLNNNIYNGHFYVKRDLNNPFVDVSFDGVRIFNNDLVSSSPKILITLTDENKNFLIQDTSALDISLTNPQGNSYKISYDRPDVNFTPADIKNRTASVMFSPEKLADGSYILSVIGRDAAGNSSSVEPYQVRFRVNNKPSVSRFYPYPNPFSSKMNFVFTLTGEEVPEEIHIRIMTIGGTIVKEIFKQDLGPIHIGNNITTFTWDGTDQFGDKLANGVYIYKVTVKDKGKNVEVLTDDNEIYFKKGMGKIVIMR